MITFEQIRSKAVYFVARDLGDEYNDEVELLSATQNWQEFREALDSIEMSAAYIAKCLTADEAQVLEDGLIGSL